ncbi:outer membrane protein assembly factor BamB family protein [Flagellimonas sp. 2504JD4-2]
MANFKHILCIACITIAHHANSQKFYSVSNQIKDKFITNNTGTLIIKDSNGLYGVDAKVDTLLWKNPNLKKVDFSSYYEIPLTSILVFEEKPKINSKLISNALGTKGVSKILVNVLDGSVILDSESLGFNAVNNTLLIPEKEAFLIDGIKDGNYVISLYNFKDKNIVWEVDTVERKLFADVKGALRDREKIGLDTQKNIWWLKNQTLIQINGNTGEIVYSNGKINFYHLDKRNKTAYILAKNPSIKDATTLTAYNTETGDELWNHSLKIFGDIIETYIDKKELIIISSRGFSIINTDTGDLKWEKPESLPLIKKIIPYDDGYFVVQDNFLLAIDANGKELWNQKIKITKSSEERPIHLYEPSEGTLLFITPSYANIVDKERGGKMWEKDLELNKTDYIRRNLKLKHHYYQLWEDQATAKILIYNEDDFYIIDQNKKEKPTVVYTFEFKNKIPRIDVRETGYLVSLENKFYFFDKTGKLIYKNIFSFDSQRTLFHTTTGIARSGFGTFKAIVGFIPNQVNQTFKSVLVSTDLGIISRSASSIYGTYSSYKNTVDDLTSMNALDVDGSLLNVFGRAKTSENSDETRLIVEAKKDGMTNIFSMNIATGKTQLVKKISYDYKDYLLDEIAGVVYFFDRKKVIVEKLQ